MTQVCFCDRCQSPIIGEHMTLTGWWQLVQLTPTVRREARRDEEVNGHFCKPCSGELALMLAFNREVPIEVRRHRLREQHPDWPELKVYGMATPGIFEDVICDRCQKSCFEQFAQFQSTWLTKEQETLQAELCPTCLETVQATFPTANETV